MSTDDTVKKAKRYTEKLVDLVRAAHAANENVRYVVYEPHLVDQVPHSHAARAYRHLQNTLLHYSIIRVCALYDTASGDKISLPKVLQLLDGKTVRKISRATHRYHATQPEPRSMIDENDAEVRRELSEFWLEYREERGQREREFVRKRVRIARMVVARAERLFMQDHLRPFRDNFIAHNLDESAREGREIRVVLGMEERAFKHAQCAVDLLYLAVNGASFSWDSMEEQHSRSAREFWGNLIYSPPAPRRH